MVYPVMSEKKDILSVVNPTKCSQDAKCKFFRSNKSVTYARGFAHFQKRMFPDQYDRFSMILIDKFGRTPITSAVEAILPSLPRSKG